MNKDQIIELYPDVMFMDGYDDCIVGISIGNSQEPKIAYNYDKVIKKLMKDGCSEEEAIEFFEYNQIGAYVGPNTPCFIIK